MTDRDKEILETFKENDPYLRSIPDEKLYEGLKDTFGFAAERIRLALRDLWKSIKWGS